MGPPGNTASSPVDPHIQAPQQFLSLFGPAGAPLPRLEMPPPPLDRLTSRHTNPLAPQVRLARLEMPTSRPIQAHQRPHPSLIIAPRCGWPAWIWPAPLPSRHTNALTHHLQSPPGAAGPPRGQAADATSSSPTGGPSSSHTRVPHTILTPTASSEPYIWPRLTHTHSHTHTHTHTI